MKRDWARYGSVVQMRREGKTFAQIAAVLGVSTTRVQQMEAIAINGMAVGKGITELRSVLDNGNPQGGARSALS